jgi:branched-chain amino acid transport system permease protein
VQRFLMTGATLLVLALLPLVLGKHLLSMAILIGLYAIVTVGLNLLMGYGGQISLCQAAFFGIGAYTSGILTVRLGVSPWLAMVAGLLVAGLVAYLVGIPTLRLKEQYLALATAGIGTVIYILFVEGTKWTGGPSGLVGIPVLSIAGFRLGSDLRFYYVVLVFGAAAVLMARAILESRHGRALRAIHTSEIAAEAMGVDTAGLKLSIFVLSAVYASLAGSLYAHYVTFISPVPFSYSESIHFASMAVIGGASSIWGGLFGAAFVTVLTELLRMLLPSLIKGAGGDVEMLFFGVLVVAVMIFLPEGLLPGLGRLLKGAVNRVLARGA